MAKKSFLQKKKSFTGFQIVIFGLVFAGVGIYALAASFAASRLPAANTGTISLATGSEPHYQGAVKFEYSYPGSLKNPRIYVTCSQNGDLVYGGGGGAGETFLLGGGWSKWVEAGGGPADCTAELYYFKKAGTNSEWNGHGQQEYVHLAFTTFPANG